MKLTCVTAVFNAIKAGNREALVRCVQSVGKLEIAHEHIFVDGASTDGTVELLRELQAGDPSVKVVTGPDTGIYNALNKGLKIAAGEWFYVLGCDDYLTDAGVMAQLLSDANEEEAIVAPVEHDGCFDYSFHKIEDLKCTLRWVYGYCHQGLIIKTDLARALGGFNERYRLCADGDMILKMHLGAHRIRYTFEAFANFSAGGINERAREKVEDEQALVLKDNLNLNEAEHRRVRHLWLPPLRVALRHFFSCDVALRVSARCVIRELSAFWLRRSRFFVRNILRVREKVYSPVDMCGMRLQGFGNMPEPVGRYDYLLWMISKSARIEVPLPGQFAGCPVEVKVDCSPMLAELLPRQKVILSCDGYVLGESQFSLDARRRDVVTAVVPACLVRRGRLLLGIGLESAPVKLSELYPEANDSRTLGLSIYSVAVSKSKGEDGGPFNRLPDAGLLGEQIVESQGILPDSRMASPVDVTVVTVVYEAVKTGRKDGFLRCLDSVQSQRGCRTEHLIVDGGSKDGTVELLKSYAEGRVPLRFISTPDNGIYDAMNRGLVLARGKYVIFLNSDDYYHNPDGLRKSFEALETSAAAFSYGPAKVVNECGKTIDHAFASAHTDQIFGGMTICHQTILARSDVMRALGGFDLRYRSASDYDFLLRMMFERNRGMKVDVCFVTFQTGGYSFVNFRLVDEEVASLYRELYNRYFSAGLSERESWLIRKTGSVPSRIAMDLQQVADAMLGADNYRDRNSAAFREMCERCFYNFESREAEAIWATYKVWFPWGKPRGGLARMVKFAVRRPRDFWEVLAGFLSERTLRIPRFRDLLVERCKLISRRSNQYVLPYEEDKLQGDFGYAYLGVVFDEKLVVSPVLPTSWYDRLLCLGLYLKGSGPRDRVIAEVLVNGSKVAQTALFVNDGVLRYDVVVPANVVVRALQISVHVRDDPAAPINPRRADSCVSAVFGGLSFHCA